MAIDKRPKAQEYEEKLVRILSKDIPGDLGAYVGLTKIRGISWGMANAICRALNLDKRRKIGSLTKEEVTSINEFVKNPKILSHISNRRTDLAAGENRHLVGTELELQKDFDIGRLKKIKSYKGLRHSAGQPVRGQSTRAHFRRNKKRGVGIKKRGKAAEGGLNEKKA